MRIVFDLDGVIATGDENTVYSNGAKWNYSNCTVVPGARVVLQKLKEQGHYIIIHTARWTRDKIKTHEWLENNNIPFNELHMSKPSADVYIDDRGFAFDGDWNSLMEHINNIKKEMDERISENKIN